jgi:hypothetical protein
MISAKSTKTPETAIFRNRFSDRKCIKYEITVATLIDAISSAIPTESAPRWYPVTTTDRVVSASRITRIIA